MSLAIVETRARESLAETRREHVEEVRVLEEAHADKVKRLVDAHRSKVCALIERIWYTAGALRVLPHPLVP